MSKQYNDAQKQELERLVSNLRSLVQSSVVLDAPLKKLTEMADAAEALNAQASEFAGKRPFRPYSAPIDGDLNTILPWSVISGRFHPTAAPVVMTAEAGKLVGTVTFGVAYEGPPNGVHGAIVAGVYDQVLAFAAMMNGTPGHTATLTTTFRSLTPIHTELRFEAQVDRTDGRKIYTSGSCYANGEKVSEAEGLFIHFRPPDSD